MTVSPAPAKPGFWTRAKPELKKIGASFAAAFSTPEAIKAEKYLAIIGLTRAAILVPSAAGIVFVLVRALGG